MRRRKPKGRERQGVTLHKGGPGTARTGAGRERSAGGHGGGLDELPDAGSAHLKDSHRSHLPGQAKSSHPRQPLVAARTQRTLEAHGPRRHRITAHRVLRHALRDACNCGPPRRCLTGSRAHQGRGARERGRSWDGARAA
jgi:hypothetical protein